MPVRSAHAVWTGDLPSGSGTVSVESGAIRAAYSFPSRFETGSGTNPEELLGAALAGCFSMALANALAKDGHPATRVATEAKVHLDLEDGARVAKIVLTCEAVVPELDADAFQAHAAAAKDGCPIGRTLAIPVELEAALR